MKDNDEGLRYEVAEHDAVQTAQLRHNLDQLYVLAMGRQVCCDVRGPAQIIQHHTKSNGFGLVVVLGQVCSHVGETETEATEDPHESITDGSPGLITYKTEQYDLMLEGVCEFHWHRRASGHIDTTEQELEERDGSHHQPLTIVFYQQCMCFGEVGGHLEDADDLEGADKNAGQAHGVEEVI